MTFAEILDLLRDGKPRRFTNPRLNGYFYKARSPARAIDTDLDGALSSITWHGNPIAYSKSANPESSYPFGAAIRPALMALVLEDFTCDDWMAELAWHHPLEKRS